MDTHGVRYKFGVRQIQNLSSPHYIAAVKRIVAAMGEHYADNPNALAFSIDNEIGDEISDDHLVGRLSQVARKEIRHHRELKQGRGRSVLGNGVVGLGSGADTLE